MTQINRSNPAANIHPGAHLKRADSLEASRFPGLPSPLTDASEPTDALGMMMMAMERMSQTSLNQKQQKIESTQAKLDEAMEELMDHMMEAAAKASKAAKKDGGGGIFGAIAGFVDDVVDAVAGFVGKLAGTVIDFAEDLVMGPIDLMIGVIKNIDNPQKWGEIFKAELKQLYTNGDTAKKFEGAVKGVVQFAVDALEFAGSYMAVMEAGLRGENIMDAMGDQFRGLWDSFKSNLIDNPDFMAVVGDVAKVVAIAASAVSGGALAPLAIGLIILSDLDARHELGPAIGKALGNEEAGPWISMGVAVAATIVVTAVTLGAGGASAGGASAGGASASGASAGGAGSNETLQLLSRASAALGGASQIYTGVKTIQQANEDAAHIESLAEMMQIQNRMAQLQRLMTELIGDLEESAEARTDAHEMGSHIHGIQAATNQAAIFKG